MKKLLLSIILISEVFTTQAQTTKPTKDETIKFMATVLKSVEGSVSEDTITLVEQSFNGSSLNTKLNQPGLGVFGIETYSDIKWESYIDDSFHAVQQKGEPYLSVFIYFKTKMKYEGEGISKLKFKDYLCMNIPSDKLPSFKKAILRLVEIAKEENKDPFGN